MKKRTFLGIAAATAAILLLLGLGIFLAVIFKDTWDTASTSSSGTSLSDTLTEITADSGLSSEKTSSEAETLPSTEAESSYDTQTAAAYSAAAAASAPLPEHHLIFVGDSRTVGMAKAEASQQDSCTYIGEVGEGYRWFVDSGMEQMETAMEQFPEAPVILNLGVNDLDALDSYLELYSGFPDRYPDHTFYFMSVNPVTDQAAHVTNEQIASFNAGLRNAFPDQYLDSNTYLRIREFDSPDGLHYSEGTYRAIHDFVVRQIIS